MQFGETPHQGQTHAHAGRMLGRVRTLLERFEDDLAEFGCHSRTVVFDLEERAPFRRGDAHPDGGVGRRVAHRVREEVLDDPLDLRGVDRDDDRLDVGLQT